MLQVDEKADKAEKLNRIWFLNQNESKQEIFLVQCVIQKLYKKKGNRMAE